MLVDLEELKNTNEKCIELEFNEYLAELGNSVDVTGNIKVELTLYGVKLTGSVETEIDLTCDLCLNTYTQTLHAEINEDYLFGTLIPEGVKEYELQSNDFVNDLNGNTVLDVTDIVYQLILLELPSQNLCSEDCKGSKEYQFVKSQEIIDPRLEQFKNLLDHKEN